MIPDELDGRLDNYSRQQDEEDPLDRIVESQEDDMPDADEFICEQSSQISNETAAFHPSGSDTFLPVPGPRRSVLVDLDAESQPYDFFCKICGEDTFDLLADQTNLYAAQKGMESWEDVSAEEMQSFVGIQLAMGMVQLPSMYDYWSTNPILSAPGIIKGIGETDSALSSAICISMTIPGCLDAQTQAMTSCTRCDHFWRGFDSTARLATSLTSN